MGLIVLLLLAGGAFIALVIGVEMFVKARRLQSTRPARSVPHDYADLGYDISIASTPDSSPGGQDSGSDGDSK